MQVDPQRFSHHPKMRLPSVPFSFEALSHNGDGTLM
jgi:hypothetical protein